MKQREAKKPSFPDFGVPPVLRLAKSRFSGLAAIYLFFMILYFVFIIIDSSDCTVFTIFFVRHSLFASHYLYLLLRPFQSFYFSVYGHLVVSNQIVGCIPGLHSG